MKLAHSMNDISTSADTAFTCVKILASSDCNIDVAAIEESGQMTIMTLHKASIRGNFSRLPETRRMKGCVTLGVHKPMKSLTYRGPQSSKDACVVAFGTLETVTVMDIRSQLNKPIFKYERPHF